MSDSILMPANFDSINMDQALSPASSPPDSPSYSSTTSVSQSGGDYRGYDHVHWYVGNAKQAATYYIARLGFRIIAYKALDTGSRAIATYVVRNGDVTFLLTSPLRVPEQAENLEDKALLTEITDHLRKHGDAVKDVAFEVDSVQDVYDQAVANGAKILSAPQTLSDKFGTVKTAKIQTYGETVHTLIERKDYRGVFMPGFQAPKESADPLQFYLPTINFEAVDHCVGNQDWNQMEDVCQ